MTWILHPLIALFLFIDSIVYTLVGYVYNLFMLLARTNVSSIYSAFSPVIDRLNALIIVFVLFKLGISFVQYLLNPETFEDKSKGGINLLKSIVIVAALLVSYNFIFDLMNDFSMLMIGSSYGYSYSNSTLGRLVGLEDDEDDGGLISRLIFGADSAENVDNFGKYLAINTLHIFIHGYDYDDGNGTASSAEELLSTTLSESVDEDDEGKLKEFDINLVGLTDDIWVDVAYRWPLVSTGFAIYLIYILGKAAIQMGVRVFKLMVMQIMAPIAIISLVGSSFKESKVWQKYIKTLGSIYIDVFMRVATMFITIGFLSFVTTQGNLSNMVTDVNGMTKFLLKIFLIVAAIQMVDALPKLIDEIFDTKISNGSGKGFANFMGHALGTTAGVGIGAVAGLAATRGTGLGFGSRLAAAATGAYNGGRNGYSAQNFGDFFTKSGNTFKNTDDQVMGWAKEGGFGQHFRNSMQSGSTANRQAALDSNYKDKQKAFEDAQRNAIKNKTYVDENGVDTGINYTDSEDSFASALINNDETLNRLQAELSAESSTDIGAVPVEPSQSDYMKESTISPGTKVEDKEAYTKAQADYQKALASHNAAKEQKSKNIAAKNKEISERKEEIRKNAKTAYKNAMNSASGADIDKKRKEAAQAKALSERRNRK